MTMNILNWENETVQWAGTEYDVSNAAVEAEPILRVLRAEARKFDDRAESILHYSNEVARYATEIANGLKEGYMPQTLHHQRPNDLNKAIVEYTLLAEVINALTNVIAAQRATA